MSAKKLHHGYRRCSLNLVDMAAILDAEAASISISLQKFTRNTKTIERKDFGHNLGTRVIKSDEGRSNRSSHIWLRSELICREGLE